VWEIGDQTDKLTFFSFVKRGGAIEGTIEGANEGAIEGVTKVSVQQTPYCQDFKLVVIYSMKRNFLIFTKACIICMLT